MGKGCGQMSAESGALSRAGALLGLTGNGCDGDIHSKDRVIVMAGRFIRYTVHVIPSTYSYCILFVKRLIVSSA